MKKIRGKCLICKEQIVLGDMTRWKDDKFYCAKCQVYLNRGLEYKEILKKRREDLLRELYEIDIVIEGETDVFAE